MKKSVIGIIILNWNGFDDTQRLLVSLRNLVTSYEYHIYVVDNASEQRDRDRLGKDPTITFIPLVDNQGFTGGNNEGIRRALRDNVDYCWIINNDTTVDSYALDPLVKPFEQQKNIGITVSKIYFMKGHEYHIDRYSEQEKGNVLWYAGGLIDWNNVYGSHRGVDEVDRGQYDQQEETTYATGCSMLVSRKVFEDIGFFDDRYFAYLEDMDFSMRVKQKGLKILYVPQSKVWHKNAGSTARPGNDLHQYYMTRNRLLFGMTYASSRTKFALLREAMKFVLTGGVAQKQGVLDWMKGRWGKRFDWKQTL